MQGDFTRLTFARERTHRAVLLQQGRVLLDADWNEQAEITAHHDEQRTRDVVGPSGGPADGAGFAVVDAAGAPPAGTAWADLRVTAGTYYVEGVLAEAAPAVDATGAPAPGWPLGDQPHLRAVGDDPGLPEPADDGRYALYLDVWTHHVTAEEEPALRESALGGPDTTTRARTVWQVRTAPLEPGATCVDLHAPGWLEPEPGTLAASLEDEPPESDPCRISTSGGYRRLENQLYRVQVHDVPAAGEARFLWSRENGSVVAGLVAFEDGALTVDREGRDEELSFRDGSWVEVTSEDRVLRRLPGHLARLGPPEGLRLPVAAWDGDPLPSVASLGRAPVVRRWEGPARPASGTVALEDGVRVRFGTTGTHRTGDHWLVPARTVRLQHGQTALSGTIDWPLEQGLPAHRPPRGPERRVTPLAVLDRSEGTWTLVSDCRRLFAPLTGMTALHVLGGDGQESLRGTPLPFPVRFAVRNGGLPVAGAAVRLTTEPPGALAPAPAPPGAADPDALTLPTDADGVVEVGWLLGKGPSAQRLVAQRLDDAGQPVGQTAVATARALRPVLRLVGGDGQHVAGKALVLPQQVRVVVDSDAGPVPGVELVATTRAGTQPVGGLVAEARDPDEPAPADLQGRGDREVRLRTAADGSAGLWWELDPQGPDSQLLDVRIAGRRDGLRVTGQRGRGGGTARTPGVHITALRFGQGEPFENDDVVDPGALASGVLAELDGPVDGRTVRPPVVRVVLQLPWPVTGDERELWSASSPVGLRSVELLADVGADGPLLVWTPRRDVAVWLQEGLRAGLRRAKWQEPLVGRFVVDGWGVVAEDGHRHLNGHARAVSRDGRTLLELPTDDEVTGGAFVQWFWLAPG